MNRVVLQWLQYWSAEVMRRGFSTLNKQHKKSLQVVSYLFLYLHSIYWIPAFSAVEIDPSTRSCLQWFKSTYQDCIFFALICIHELFTLWILYKSEQWASWAYIAEEKNLDISEEYYVYIYIIVDASWIRDIATSICRHSEAAKSTEIMYLCSCSSVRNEVWIFL